MRKVSTTSTQSSLSPPWSVPDQNLARPKRETESTRQLSCDVVFGSPSADCMGTGVCRISARSGITPLEQKGNLKCRSTVALLFPIEGGNGLSMVLTRALLCTQLYKTHLRKGALVLESPCVLPEEMATALGLKINELSAGEYPIQETDGFLRIDFKVLN